MISPTNHHFAVYWTSTSATNCAGCYCLALLFSCCRGGGGGGGVLEHPEHPSGYPLPCRTSCLLLFSTDNGKWSTVECSYWWHFTSMCLRRGGSLAVSMFHMPCCQGSWHVHCYKHSHCRSFGRQIGDWLPKPCYPSLVPYPLASKYKGQMCGLLASHTVLFRLLATCRSGHVTKLTNQLAW